MTTGVTIRPEHIGRRVRVVEGGHILGPPVGSLGVVKGFDAGYPMYAAIEMDVRHASSTTCGLLVPSGRGNWYRTTSYLELVDETPVAHAPEAAEAAAANGDAGVNDDVAADVVRKEAPSVGLLESDQYVWAGNEGELSEPMTVDQMGITKLDYHVVVIYRLTPVARWSLRLEAAATDAEREALQ